MTASSSAPELQSGAITSPAVIPGAPSKPARSGIPSGAPNTSVRPSSGSASRTVQAPSAPSASARGPARRAAGERGIRAGEADQPEQRRRERQRPGAAVGAQQQRRPGGERGDEQRRAGALERAERQQHRDPGGGDQPAGARQQRDEQRRDRGGGGRRHGGLRRQPGERRPGQRAGRGGRQQPPDRRRERRDRALERVLGDPAALVGHLAERVGAGVEQVVEIAAQLGIGLERAVERRAQLAGQVRARLRERREPGADAPRGGGRRAGADRVRPRERLVEDEPERVEVGAPVDRLPRGLLGRHVGERADDVARPRQRVLAGELGDAEVGQLRRAAARARHVGDDHVLRLDVAVDDAALVGVGERVGERQPDPQDVAVRQLVRRLELGERAALDQLGDEVAVAVRLAGVEQRDDRVVVEPRDRAGLALGALGLHAGGRDDLDRDGAPEALVARRVDGRRSRPRPSRAPSRYRPIASPASGVTAGRSAVAGTSRVFHAREGAPSLCTEGFSGDGANCPAEPPHIL